MNAKIQILMSSAGLKKRARVNFSGMASSRSLLIRRTIKSRSSVFKKRHDWSALSGKSTRRKYAKKEHIQNTPKGEGETTNNVERAVSLAHIVCTSLLGEEADRTSKAFNGLHREYQVARR
ncbi:MAG: hypothetical protein Q9204_006328 [Flavoplaca sp. TL-2023a]